MPTCPVLHRFNEVASTNDIALDMGRRGKPEGTVVIARRQTKGRGRLGRQWWDEAGNSVLMSVLLKPKMSARDVPRLAFVAGVSVADCFVSYGCREVSLKWPNDVLLRGKKAGGILVEAENGVAVVGIGINVNQASFPSEMAEAATSIALETGSHHEIDEFASRLAGTFLRDYQTYLAQGFEEIMGRWRKYMWGLGRQANVRTSGELINGEITGVDAEGALLVVDSAGAERKVVAADSIQLVPECMP